MSDHYLPEAFNEKPSTQAEGNPTHSADKEKYLVMSLELKLRDEQNCRLREQDDHDEDKHKSDDRGDEDENDDK